MSSDGSNKLVRMANQIADNFDYGPDQDKAVEGVLDHLTRFWTPDMKHSIVEQSRSGNIGLNEIAAAAVGALAENLGQPA
ncbi:MAG: formate dehydrogenase subunit delta [Gammaproteobacteria bacterium]